MQRGDHSISRCTDCRNSRPERYFRRGRSRTGRRPSRRASPLWPARNGSALLRYRRKQRSGGGRRSASSRRAAAGADDEAALGAAALIARSLRAAVSCTPVPLRSDLYAGRVWASIDDGVATSPRRSVAGAVIGGVARVTCPRRRNADRTGGARFGVVVRAVAARQATRALYGPSRRRPNRSRPIVPTDRSGARPAHADARSSRPPAACRSRPHSRHTANIVRVFPAADVDDILSPKMMRVGLPAFGETKEVAGAQPSDPYVS